MNMDRILVFKVLLPSWALALSPINIPKEQYFLSLQLHLPGPWVSVADLWLARQKQWLHVECLTNTKEERGFFGLSFTTFISLDLNLLPSILFMMWGYSWWKTIVLPGLSNRISYNMNKFEINMLLVITFANFSTAGVKFFQNSYWFSFSR